MENTENLATPTRPRPARRWLGFFAVLAAIIMNLLDSTVVIAARVVQGLFGAVMIPRCFGLLRDLFPPAELGKAFGALGPVIGLSTILGPIVAGTLIDANLFGTGWRMVFGINLPLAVFAVVG